MRAAVEKFLFRQPLVKALVPSVFGIMGNILAGTYVFDITTTVDGRTVLVVANSFQSISFWGILVLLVCMALYGRGLHKFETEAFIDYTNKEHLRSLATKELWPTLMSGIEADIKAGKVKTLAQIYKILDHGDRRDG